MEIKKISRSKIKWKLKKKQVEIVKGYAALMIWMMVGIYLGLGKVFCIISKFQKACNYYELTKHKP